MILNLLKERLNNYLGLLGVLVFFFFGCKKEGSSNSETNTNIPCSIPVNKLIINNISAEITKDTAYINGDTLYTAEYETSPGNGISIRFSANSRPSNGDHVITTNILDLKNQEDRCFIELYQDGMVKVGFSGKVNIKSDGSHARATACDLEVYSPLGANFKLDFNGFLP
jgi:hypothetical protein